MLRSCFQKNSNRIVEAGKCSQHCCPRTAGEQPLASTGRSPRRCCWKIFEHLLVAFEGQLEILLSAQCSNISKGDMKTSGSVAAEAFTALPIDLTCLPAY